ncbi:MAG: aspartyl/glutamyl-tRNA(Asn/Gln) amidotransferase subunit C [Bacteroidota bacterium]|nr:MAG: glutamyl-tRNA amidotransferase subunit C [Bacteroidetes bacterium OLB12]GIL22430.1 MAG: aspartyl/glutamyl-tRNA(Asn/Gln) amidotransferase subunit C [Bacteroidota bacterium]HNR73328.1 Asp-tRNA(Asn)/Glu-tRNA(Gln) amidotransferase subunit GatC [Cyclobacteriaceae bacterium]
MELDKETLNKIAHLARLEFNEKDAEAMLKDMSSILSFVEKLNEVNTEGVEPLTTMSHELNALREDKISPHLNTSTALESAPEKDNTYFRVPKVLE